MGLIKKQRSDRILFLMTFLEAGRVKSAESQRAFLPTLTTEARLSSFEHSQFIGSSTAELQTPLWKFTSSEPDYIRLLGLNSMLAGQYGFETVGGGRLRHQTKVSRKEWIKSPYAPEHELALAIYLASINCQSIGWKDYLYEKLNGTYLDEPFILGVWGLKFSVDESLVYPANLDDLGWMADRVMERYRYPSPILLPDRELSRGLAALDYTGDDADNPNQDQFLAKLTSTLPAASRVLEGLVDLGKVFPGIFPQELAV